MLYFMGGAIFPHNPITVILRLAAFYSLTPIFVLRREAGVDSSESPLGVLRFDRLTCQRSRLSQDITEFGLYPVSTKVCLA